MEKKNSDHTIVINKISETTKASLKTRVLTAIIGIAVVAAPVLLGDWAFLALILLALFIGVIEIIRCAKKKYSRWMYLCMFLCCVAICLWPMFRVLFFDINSFNGHAYSLFDSMYLSAIVLVVSVFALFYIIMWDENFTVRDACFVFTIGILVAFGFQAITFIRMFPAKLLGDVGGYYTAGNTIGTLWLFVFLVLSVMMTDTGAYFTGILFGHKKVNPRISPNKTWAGFFGGLIISFLVTAGFGLIMAATNNPILPAVKGFSVFDLDHWYNIVILAAIIPPFATLGDFVFSAIKRYYGIKDFGNLLPGHGGILDRCDSLIFSAIVMGIFVFVAYSICYGIVYNPFL